MYRAGKHKGNADVRPQHCSDEKAYLDEDEVVTVLGVTVIPTEVHVELFYGDIGVVR